MAHRASDPASVKSRMGSPAATRSTVSGPRVVEGIRATTPRRPVRAAGLVVRDRRRRATLVFAGSSRCPTRSSGACSTTGAPRRERRAAAPAVAVAVVAVAVTASTVESAMIRTPMIDRPPNSIRSNQPLARASARDAQKSPRTSRGDHQSRLPMICQPTCEPEGRARAKALRTALQQAG